MRAIIAGGTGLIGRALVAELLHNGYEVVVLSRRPEQASDFPKAVRLERWDARTASGWGALVDGARAVINLAGENISNGRWTPAKKRRIRASRLDAGQAVVEAIQTASHKPDVVIQASGVGYYGSRGEESLNEAAKPGNDFMARLAVDWEAATEPVEALGVRRAIVRSGVVLSREGGALPKLLLPFCFLVGGPLGNGRQVLSWIHIADQVAAIRFLMEQDAACGPFNLTAPNPVSNAAFSRALSRVMRRPSWIPVPAFALRLLFGEMSTVLLDGQRAIPTRLLDLGFIFKYADVETALQSLWE